MVYILFMPMEQLAFTVRSSLFSAVIGYERFQKIDSHMLSGSGKI